MKLSSITSFFKRKPNQKQEEPAATKNHTPKVEEAFEESDDEESSEGEESTPE